MCVDKDETILIWLNGTNGMLDRRKTKCSELHVRQLQTAAASLPAASAVKMVSSVGLNGLN